ncbi:hypothetical protein VB264_05365 [Arcicella aquatica]|uniref:Uncharacterized protein n=1 Tax=Arcicella aquatica TaxID=217141 RepID=A0ABU5QJF6_9BACT|nr:hypothetical protein [Arcicella aquatica]MEA5257206.1 hypothetical protein [Arcicella aquatica]
MKFDEVLRLYLMDSEYSAHLPKLKERMNYLVFLTRDLEGFIDTLTFIIETTTDKDPIQKSHHLGLITGITQKVLDEVKLEHDLLFSVDSRESIVVETK